MKIKFGALVVDGRGKIGGHVASKNRAGAYLRTKVTPSNPQTSYQIGVRSFFTTVSQAWRGLTESQRDQWRTAVPNFSVSDIFGDSKQLSGSQLHQKLNLNLLNAGQSVITTPPVPAGADQVTIDSLAADNSSNTTILTMGGAVPAGTSMMVFATPAVSPGKTFVKNLYRLIAVAPPAEATPYDFSTEYQAKFGAVGATGQKIGVRCVFVNNSTGESAFGGAVETIIVA